MVYTKRIVCFANSYKPGGRCLAGKDVNSGAWIRPVSNRPTQALSFFEYCFEGYHSAQLLDIVDVPFLKHVPRGHQTENHLIGKEPWKKTGTLHWDDLDKFQDRPESLWANVDSTKAGGANDCMSPQIAAEYDHSLLLIRQQEFRVQVSERARASEIKKILRGRFSYKQTIHSLTITDPVARAAFQDKIRGSIT